MNFRFQHQDGQIRPKMWLRSTKEQLVPAEVGLAVVLLRSNRGDNPGGDGVLQLHERSAEHFPGSLLLQLHRHWHLVRHVRSRQRPVKRAGLLLSHQQTHSKCKYDSRPYAIDYFPFY